MREDREELIDAYLRGSLDESERKAFALRLQQDAELRADIEHQQRIDAALARRFMPPPAASFKAVGAAPSTNHVQRIRRSFPLIRGLAAAAVVALAALGVWYAWPRTGAPTPVSPAPSRSRPLDVVYRNEVASGFKIDWECKQNREFAGTYWWVLGQGLLLHTQDIPPNVAVLGLTWGRAITPKTVYLLARVDEKEVMVFADRLADDPGQTWPAHSELHLFRETVGELVLYEVTPLEEPYLLKHFYQPEMDPEWLKLPPYPGLPH